MDYKKEIGAASHAYEYTWEVFIMSKIVVIGGGWAGCAASIAARKHGHQVVLLEKTDLLLGAGNVGGIMRNNGRFTAAEENICLGAGELFAVTDRLSTHRNVNFPGHDHASFYDVALVEPEVRRLLQQMEIEIRFMARAVDVEMKTKTRIGAIVLAPGTGDMEPGKENSAEEGRKISGDYFIETTGSSGPMGNCARFGNGCAMCVQRCPTFGPRVSITARAGLSDLMGLRESGKPGAFSGSCKLEKRTLSGKIQKKLKKDGFAMIPLPEHLINRKKLQEKVCQQYALDAFAENLILIDTGHAKLMTPFFDLESLRQIEGLENARFVDPYGGGKGNSLRYMCVGQRDSFMRAQNMENLFLGGEKSGFFVGHTEAISTGSLAGFNAAMAAAERPMLRLPRSLAIGELLAFAQEALDEEDGLKRRFTFAGGEFFSRMKNLGLYHTEPGAVKKIVEKAGLLDVYNRGLSVVE